MKNNPPIGAIMPKYEIPDNGKRYRLPLKKIMPRKRNHGQRLKALRGVSRDDLISVTIRIKIECKA
jgi:hypothetical protein|tara:strand:+ start:399 stop:596 length:198 start_codon:yes stop_codon:yes gene_type:complete